MCLKGTTSQDMYGSTPVAMYKESVLRRSAFQARLAKQKPSAYFPNCKQTLSPFHSLRRA